MTGRRKAVTIVEDEAGVAELQRVLLREWADVVLMTEDFRRALLSETWAGVDVAVVDLMLPDITGEDICRYLRDEQPQVRRVICTAKPIIHLPGLRDLADVVIQKPFRPSDFVSAVVGGHGPSGH